MDDRKLLETVMDIVGRENCLDDCAVLPCGDQFMVATTDMLHRTTDFVSGMTDWQAGWMSAAVTLSDIASMGAAPKYLLIAVGLDNWRESFRVMQGAKDCCTQFGAAIIGGDIDRDDDLTVVTTGLGLVDRDHLVRRTGVHPGDFVCITGHRGRPRRDWTGTSSTRKHSSNRSPAWMKGRSLAGQERVR